MNTYIEERFLPYIESKKKEIHHKKKVHKGLTLSAMIVLATSLLSYVIGINIPTIYVLFITITYATLSSACILYIFDRLFYTNYKLLANHIAELEELYNLFKYQEGKADEFITIIENKIKEINKHGY